MAGTTLSCVMIYTASSAVSWFEEFHLQSGVLVSACVGIGSLIMARIMFALDSDIDPQTGHRRWNTARGDLAEILGWCAGWSKMMQKIIMIPKNSWLAQLISTRY